MLIFRLTDLKKAMVYHRSHPPISLKIDWKYENLLSRLTFGLPAPIQPPAQGLRFDVIVISEQGGRQNFSEITQLATLPIESLAATPSFLFLWLPSSDLLEVGRALLQRWGFRRAEDIVWVKTNHNEIERWKSGGPMPSRRRREEDSMDGVFVRTKEHCLMGIRGTVRRSVIASLPTTIAYPSQVDSHFIHCNIDTDVVIAEESPDGNKHKPEELFNIIENFCMGRRRLEIFGSDYSMRPGWLTVGDSLTTSTYDPKEYLSYFQDGNLVGHHQGNHPDGLISHFRNRSPKTKVTSP
jgi:N6-adenosine-specific RNA methylase IME4